ncbi:DUF6542 domain-containing protein [Thermobifida halotolerans]|uniref:DUF6542 domain-containing protein n=1 Tax=Thermobifida halotolerans TaxID=483545 RepID=UPI000AB83DFC|nr:DUF6542 domain-containing protein [Thermobifida halotolerans]
MAGRDTRGSRMPRRSASAPRHRNGASSRSVGPPLRLTARGAIVCVVLVSFVSALAASAVEHHVVNGVGFVTACALTALTVRPSDLLALSVSPPLAYFGGVLAAECLLTAGGDGFVRGVAIGVGARLADVAPWLFGGTALLLVITLVRGLLRNVRELGDELNGRHPRRLRRGP